MAIRKHVFPYVVHQIQFLFPGDSMYLLLTKKKDKPNTRSADSAQILHRVVVVGFLERWLVGKLLVMKACGPEFLATNPSETQTTPSDEGMGAGG